MGPLAALAYSLCSYIFALQRQRPDEEHPTGGGILIARSSVNIYTISRLKIVVTARIDAAVIIYYSSERRKKWPPTTHLHDENELPLIQP